MAAPPDALKQKCPTCLHFVDVGDAEPLARIPCPKCGQKFKVERSFDNFVLVETLGVGGMGSVYKAKDTRLERFVALKLLRKELSADPAEAARLEHEARMTAAVNSPNVVQVYSAGSAHGQIYLVMELVDHGSLDDLMAQHAKVPELQVLLAGIQVAKGLQAAHEKGLIHRDVKPANILFSNTQTAKIGDFGLAGVAEQKGEATSEIWGTPYYVAPERLNNEPEDFRSDIYSLGATLFHALAGKPPMEGESTSAAELRQLKSHPPDLHKVAPEVSRETARIINQMLAPNPANRFTSYAHVVDQLQRAYVALRAASGGGGGTRASRGWMIGVAAAVVAVAIGAGFYFLRKPAAPVTVSDPTPPAATAAPEDTAALQKKYEDARRLLVEGKYDLASTAFAKVITEAGNRQPTLNWARLHAGLAALLQKKTQPARDTFQAVERAGPFSNAKAEADLARFFVETSRLLAATGPVRGSDAANLNPKTVDAFALFLVGIKDWQLGEFAEAAAFLEKFGASEPPPDLAWINEYKPIARKFLEGVPVFTEWKKLPPKFETPAELKAAVTKLKALEEMLPAGNALKEAVADDGKRRAAELAQLEKAENDARAAEQKKLLDEQSPAWEAALAEARKKIAAYDFTGARDAIDAAKVTEPSLVQARDAERKKAGWLIDWKRKLLADLKTGSFKGEVALNNNKYQGVASATEQQIELRIGGFGKAPFTWDKFPPKSLLNLSLDMIRQGPPDIPDRQWLAAVFAHATGLPEATVLAEAAAKAKPEYQEQLGILLKK